MDNINFLKQIITTEHDYWLVARKEEYRQYCETKRGKDSVWIISIPYDLKRGVKEDEILLKDLEKLRNANLSNICLSEEYAPFQYGITLYNIYVGFPIEKDIKQTIIRLLGLKSNSLWDYQKLMNSEQNVQESDTTDVDSGNEAG